MLLFWCRGGCFSSLLLGHHEGSELTSQVSIFFLKLNNLAFFNHRLASKQLDDLLLSLVLASHLLDLSLLAHQKLILELSLMSKLVNFGALFLILFQEDT